MSSMGRYLLSVVCIGMACGIGIRVSENCSGTEKAAKLVFGLVLFMGMFSPILRYDGFNTDFFQDTIFENAERYAEEGECIRTAYLQKSINEKICAYIEGVAEEEGIQLKAEVTTEGTCISEVVLSGKVTTEKKTVITNRLQKTLDVGDGAIIWKP